MKKIEKEYLQKIIEKDSLVRSDQLILSKNKYTLLDRKLIDIAITRLFVHQGSNKLTSIISANELKNLLGRTGNSLYPQLKATADRIASPKMLIEDGKGNFILFNIIEECRYINGNLEVIFSDRIRPHVLDIQSSYTTMKISTLLSFNHLSSLKIYEHLKTQAYKLKKNKDVMVSYSLASLKMSIGLVDMEEVINYDVTVIDKNGQFKTVSRRNSIAAAIKDGADAQHCLDRSSNETYKTWRNFQVRVLDVAREELLGNPKSDIYFEYIPKRTGKGGKITGVNFIIKKNPNFRSAMVENESEEKLFINQAMNLTAEEPFTRNQIRDLLETAEWDYELFKRNYEYSKTQTDIRNLYGWLTTAIKEDYAGNEMIPKVNGHSYNESKKINEAHAEYLEESEKRKKNKQFMELIEESNQNQLEMNDVEFTVKGKEEEPTEEYESDVIRNQRDLIKHMTQEQKEELMKLLQSSQD